ncbi:uncharacterized protein LOC120623873 [Pararge aegeria]|uniref:Jg11212 protein n=1 Tax=Pararge aegeria aegeria TaxID=348720 RepID=A0A8S4RIY3_9NEOP|nr:uncharacterized protein LOC120623873 [Pararge aegeria]CAH2237242.1 jg11212 [Pararge aegeria aegeria]
MIKYDSLLIIVIINTVVNITSVIAIFTSKSVDCGSYGFICDGVSRLRLCEDDKILGPAFICPTNTICNEESTDVCENSINYIDPSLTRDLRCHRSERIADTSVPDCKGYILCIPNKNRFQGIKFKCSGNTIFNGYTRTCTSPEKYKCPLGNSTKTKVQYYGQSNRKMDSTRGGSSQSASSNTQGLRPIDCKSYRFTVTQDGSPTRATYFCPSRPVRGESTVRCTVFSNNFCITLERDDQDQFIQNSGAAYRKPR